MAHDIPLTTNDSFEESSARISMRDTHEELDEFKATRKTVTDLLDYKRTLIQMGGDDQEKINEIKGKALEAINSLFNDIISTKKRN